MELLKEDNNIQQAIDDTVEQTSEIFGKVATLDKLSEFERYLEDSVLFEIISSKSDVVSINSIGKTVTKNLQTALIASGISLNGTIPRGSKYQQKSIISNRQTHFYAKERARMLETELLRAPYSQRIRWLQDYITKNPNSLPNAYELVELGIARRERECGYIEGETKFDAFYNGALMALWYIREEDFRKNKLEDTLAYDICAMVNDSPEGFRHYPLATNMALRKMAGIEFYIKTEGFDKFDNKEELLYTLRNIEAAKVTDSDFIIPFETRFIEMMKPYMDKVGISYSNNKSKNLALNKKRKY